MNETENQGEENFWLKFFTRKLLARILLGIAALITIGSIVSSNQAITSFLGFLFLWVTVWLVYKLVRFLTKDDHLVFPNSEKPASSKVERKPKTTLTIQEQKEWDRITNSFRDDI